MVWATVEQKKHTAIIQNPDFIWILIYPLIDINEKGVN